jgi:hypothetical protein
MSLIQIEADQTGTTQMGVSIIFLPSSIEFFAEMLNGLLRVSHRA